MVCLKNSSDKRANASCRHYCHDSKRGGLVAVDEAKVNSLLKASKGIFFWLNKAKPKFPFKGQRKFLAKKKVEKAKNKRL
jgi:hypothetical protein